MYMCMYIISIPKEIILKTFANRSKRLNRKLKITRIFCIETSSVVAIRSYQPKTTNLLSCLIHVVKFLVHLLHFIVQIDPRINHYTNKVAKVWVFLDEMDPIQIESQIQAQIALMQQMQDQFKRLEESCKRFFCLFWPISSVISESAWTRTIAKVYYQKTKQCV